MVTVHIQCHMKPLGSSSQENPVTGRMERDVSCLVRASEEPLDSQRRFESISSEIKESGKISSRGSEGSSAEGMERFREASERRFECQSQQYTIADSVEGKSIQN